jgi:hypothetical protein
MKLFGIHFGSSSTANLNPDQVVLKLRLIPLFGAVRTAGYSIKEAGAALHNHFDRTKELITADRIKELLQDPETLISTFRTVNNRPNLLSKPQVAALKITFANLEDRAKAQAFLIGQFVADAIRRPCSRRYCNSFWPADFLPPRLKSHSGGNASSSDEPHQPRLRYWQAKQPQGFKFSSGPSSELFRGSRGAAGRQSRKRVFPVFNQ